LSFTDNVGVVEPTSGFVQLKITENDI